VIEKRAYAASAFPPHAVDQLNFLRTEVTG
jgi:hypothetical protein